MCESPLGPPGRAGGRDWGGDAVGSASEGAGIVLEGRSSLPVL